MNSILDSYEHFVGGLVRQMRPKRILEIGLGSQGSTSVAILKHLVIKEIPCHLDIIEISPNYVAEANLRGLQLCSGVSYKLTLGSSQDPKTYEGINDCEIVCIDGHHGTSECFRDIQLCCLLNVIKWDGIFVFHDATACSVQNALKLAEEQLNLKILVLPQINLAIGKASN